jgi:hypothetical protein
MSRGASQFFTVNIFKYLCSYFEAKLNPVLGPTQIINKTFGLINFPEISGIISKVLSPA